MDSYIFLCLCIATLLCHLSVKKPPTEVHFYLKSTLVGQMTLTCDIQLDNKTLNASAEGASAIFKYLKRIVFTVHISIKTTFALVRVSSDKDGCICDHRNCLGASPGLWACKKLLGQNNIFKIKVWV